MARISLNATDVTTEKTKQANLLVAAAFLIHAVAWFLPVAKEGVALPLGLPGWQAFRIAACTVWPYDGFSIDEWYNIALSIISAATTLLFILGSGWVIAFGSRGLRRASAWIAASAFIVNSHWAIRFGSDQLQLRIGYFLWWFSFILLAAGLFRLSSRTGDQ
jgi:hypothetical protein